MGKFDTVQKDEGTTVLLQVDGKLGEYDIRHEFWLWDGFSGESLIFLEEDLNGMSDEALKEMVLITPVIQPGSSHTITRNRGGFAFVNFNFTVKD